MKTLLFALGTLALVGCTGTGLKPAGPFAKEKPILQQGQPMPAAAPVEPANRPVAAKPASPTMYVTPGDVTLDNPLVAAGKLTNELAIDSKATASLPVTVETSRIKGGVKQP